LLAAIKTPLLADATVLFTMGGLALSSKIPFSYPPLDIFPHFNALVTGKVVQDASKIPPTAPGSPTRYLLISLALEDDYQAVIYDAFTDTVIASNKANGAPTHYMLSYSYGLCNGAVTRGMVELSFSSDYSNVCAAGNGLYYQGPNQYFPFPVECLGIPPADLLTKCPSIAANQKVLVASSCQASIEKICTTQYTDNPPFLCSTTVAPQPLTVLSLSVSNTLTVSGLLSIALALLLARIFSRYRPSEEEIEEANDGRDWTAALGDVFRSCSSSGESKYVPASSKKVHAGDDDDRGVELGESSLSSLPKHASLVIHPSTRASFAGADGAGIAPLDRTSSLKNIIDSFNALLRQNEALQVKNEELQLKNEALELKTEELSLDLHEVRARLDAGDSGADTAAASVPHSSVRAQAQDSKAAK